MNENHETNDFITVEKTEILSGVTQKKSKASKTFIIIGIILFGSLLVAGGVFGYYNLSKDNRNQYWASNWRRFIN